VKEVTKERFYEIIYSKHLDVILSTMGSFPYTTEFKFRHGELFGKSVDSVGVLPDDDHIITRYFINPNVLKEE
jgi:hypothetical protein